MVFLLLSFVTVILSKSSRGFQSVMHNIALEVSTPIFLLMRSPVTLYMESGLYLKNRSNIIERNNILKDDNEKLRNQILDLLYLEGENKILKDLLHYADSSDLSFVTSRIFINSNDPFSKLAIIDNGKDYNIVKGQAIVTSKGLVGRVLKSDYKNAKILLLNDFNSKIPVYTSNSRERAVMMGRNSKYPILKYLNPKHNVQDNEIVYTSGDGIVYPANIPIGVTLLNEAKNEIIVIPFVEFNKIQFVKVIM